MADHGDSGGGSIISFVILLLVVVIGAWILTGAARNTDINSLFFSLPNATNQFGSTTLSIIEAPTVAGLGGGNFDPLETDQITDEIAAVRKEVAGLKSYPASPFTGQVTVKAVSGTRSADSTGDYIVLHASNDNKTAVVISGWRVESAVTKKKGVIGMGVDTYTKGGTGVEGPIVLNPGDDVILSSSRSPIGTSFRVNKCSGYLAQFQKFIPELSMNCPLAEDEAIDTGTAFSLSDPACIEHLSTILQCNIDLSPPESLSSYCKSFIYNQVTYQGCVNNHKNDSNFKSPQWRVFLGLSSSLWRDNREVIVLLDSQGKLVDSTTY